MDRDKRWDRVSRAYDAMVAAEGAHFADAQAAVADAYANKVYDEFILPAVIGNYAGMKDGDGVLCFNFRADRARELTNAITGVKAEAYAGQFDRTPEVELASFVCFTEYDADFGLDIAFPSEPARQILGEVIAQAGLAQLRIAETEKYAHVTFFFNNGVEKPFPGEDRVLIPSPRDVATYDHKPEMNARQVTNELLACMEKKDYAFILLNFANPDMVGHTGVLDAAVKAVETIDGCLQRISHAILERGGTLIVTADHGNCELMVDPETGDPHTAHTTNPVPVYWLAPDRKGRVLRDGGLADLAPTVLDLLGLPAVDAMTGRSLIVPG